MESVQLFLAPVSVTALSTVQSAAKCLTAEYPKECLCSFDRRQNKITLTLCKAKCDTLVGLDVTLWFYKHQYQC